MPKPTQLHAKGRPKSMQKTPKTTVDDMDHETAVRQFELELCWCIQQLEKIVNQKNGNEKDLQEAWKALTVLKNNNQPVIRKRQLMRTYFGDYRAKMAAEEKKLVKMASKIKIAEKPSPPKATFLRKSAFLTTGESFTFNFNIPPDQTDKGDFTTLPVSAKQSNAQTVTNSGDSLIPAIDCNVHAKDASVPAKDASVPAKSNIDSAKDSSFKNIKFNFSRKEFKFNFDVET